MFLDTIPMLEAAKDSKKLKYLSVAGMFADAISRIYNEISISSIYA